MNVEKLFRQIPSFNELNMDTILFESHYPVLFTCTQGQEVYLFSCCLVNASVVKWIGTKTDYEILIQLLEDKITIQEAFLNGEKEKLLIEYDGTNVQCKSVAKEQIPNELLPTAGEYMEAEEDEFIEEIAIFKSRTKNFEIKIVPKQRYVLFLNFKEKTVNLSDEYFGHDYKTYDDVMVGIGKMPKQCVAYVS